MKIKSPLYRKSPDTLSVCGKLLKKGSPIIVKKSELDDRAKDMAKKGVIIIRDINDNEAQLLRK